MFSVFTGGEGGCSIFNILGVLDVVRVYVGVSELINITEEDRRMRSFISKNKQGEFLSILSYA